LTADCGGPQAQTKGRPSRSEDAEKERERKASHRPSDAPLELMVKRAEASDRTKWGVFFGGREIWAVQMGSKTRFVRSVGRR